MNRYNLILAFLLVSWIQGDFLHLPPPQKSLAFTLDNGLQVFLIEDPKAKSSAAALTVNAGSWSEPDETPGLAHYLEHMLFLGTKSHPEESSFDAFLKNNGGSTNAFTEDNYTTFLFDVDSKELPEALLRFSEFFKEPLFNPSGASREVHAVHQEFIGHLENDTLRRYMVLKTLANPAHPWHRFEIGNIDSLKTATPEKLKEWFTHHYSSHLMTLVVISSLSLEEVKQTVVANFNTISKRDVSPFRSETPLFDRSLEEKIIYSESFLDEHTLFIAWEIPRSVAKDYDTRADEPVCYVLGHEGEHSVLHALKQKGLALELACGAIRSNPDMALFVLQIELTAKGMENYLEVLSILFDEINFLKTHPFPPYLFEEMVTMQKMRHLYPTREEPFDEVSTHAEALRYESIITYPKKTAVLQRFDEKQVGELLDALSLQHARIQLMGKSSSLPIPLTKEEPWTHTHYTVAPLPSLPQAPLDISLGYPEPNLFIPQKIHPPHAVENELPQKIIESADCLAYYKHDTLYNTPEVSCQIQVLSPLVNATRAELMVLNELYLRMVKQTLNPTTYLAKMAGLDYALSLEDNGFLLKVNGFSDHSPLLIRTVFHTLKNIPLDKKIFLIHQAALKREWENMLKESPFLLALQDFRSVFIQNYVSYEEALKALEKIDFASLEAHQKALFEQTYIQAFMYGALEKEEAKESVEEIKELFSKNPYPPKEHYQKKIACLTGPYYLERSVPSQGNGLFLAIEAPTFSLTEWGAVQTLSQMISNPFFTTLRTEQQTGYIVSSLDQEIEEHLLLFFVIESHTYDPRDLLSRTELLIEKFSKNLPSLADSFASVKKSLVDLLSKNPESMKKMGDRLFNLAFRYEGDFSLYEKRKESIEQLTFNEWEKMAFSILNRSNKGRLAVLTRGKIKQDDVLNYELAPSPAFLINSYQYEGRNG